MAATPPKTEYDDLIGMIRECIAGLSDEEIIELSAGKIGMAAFPEAGKVFVDSGLTDGGWIDRAVRDYWTRTYGPGKLVYIGSGYGEGHVSLDDLALEPASSERFDNALEERMEDGEWLAKVAQFCRDDMLTEQALRSAADGVIDFWLEPEIR